MLKKHERFVGQFEAKAEESVWGSSNSIAAVDVVDSPEFCEIFFHSRVWSSRWRVVKVNTWGREGARKEAGGGEFAREYFDRCSCCTFPHVSDLHPFQQPGPRS